MSFMTMEEKYESMGETLKVGAKVGELEVLEFRKRGRWQRSYLCRCSCGNELVISHSRLVPTRKSDHGVKSCGCKQRAQSGLVMDNKRIYNIWYYMNERCSNPKADNYERYGGKDVYVTDEWKSDFKAFLEWSLKNGYKDDLTIDRIDNDKPYSPDNCRWVSIYKQAQNRGLMKTNKTGVTGVSKYKYGYKAGIMRSGVKLDLGTYKTLSEAKEAREKAEEYFREHKTLEGYKSTN